MRPSARATIDGAVGERRVDADAIGRVAVAPGGKRAHHDRRVDAVECRAEFAFDFASVHARRSARRNVACSGIGATTTTSCALDSPALCTRTLASAIVPGTGSSRVLERNDRQRISQLRTAAHRPAGRRSIRPAPVRRMQRRPAVRSSYRSRLRPRRYRQSMTVRSSPGATSPMCAPPLARSGELPSSSSSSRTSSFPLPTR